MSSLPKGGRLGLSISREKISKNTLVCKNAGIFVQSYRAKMQLVVLLFLFWRKRGAEIGGGGGGKLKQEEEQGQSK